MQNIFPSYTLEQLRFSQKKSHEKPAALLTILFLGVPPVADQTILDIGSLFPFRHKKSSVTSKLVLHGTANRPVVPTAQQTMFRRKAQVPLLTEPLCWGF